MRFALLALLAAACTRSNPQISGPVDLYVARVGDLAGADLAPVTFDLSMPPDLSVPDDLAGADLSGRDLSSSPRDLTTRDFASLDLASPWSCVRINEVMLGTVGKPSDEFVELVNPCDTAINLDGWSLAYRSATNNGNPTNPDAILFSFGPLVIGGHSYRVFAGSQFTSSKDGLFINGLSSSIGGGVALADSFNFIVDSVAYGSVVADHNFLEGSAAPLPPDGSSIARSPDGFDSDDNSADFVVRATPTPRAANP